eukprot:CAMPEP_0194050662 /NCGR_PEP_ID=MMETSP0009_2-20130614/36425_1 /TAXON_ID=210454 /ORGANISM="Grammatophora oceanica, Strain CCMP 410" /LENGTH=73 /DNA_ID=CAMNT_0038697403 /DNA_START=207 /DNA_END=424 /DNA_ORIENTATION=-
MHEQKKESRRMQMQQRSSTEGNLDCGGNGDACRTTHTKRNLFPSNSVIVRVTTISAVIVAKQCGFYEEKSYHT